MNKGGPVSHVPFNDKAAAVFFGRITNKRLSLCPFIRHREPVYEPRPKIKTE
jgi:hypothetical protein